jgi:hypothetical protein
LKQPVCTQAGLELAKLFGTELTSGLVGVRFDEFDVDLVLRLTAGGRRGRGDGSGGPEEGLKSAAKASGLFSHRLRLQELT